MAIEWSVIKQALDKAIRLEGTERAAYLQELAENEPELQSEVAAYLDEDDDDEDSLLLNVHSLDASADPNAATREAVEVSPNAPTRGDDSPTLNFDPQAARDDDDDRTIDQGGLLTALSPDEASDPIASIVGDKYDSFKKIGQGGMGAVYRAREKRLNRVVAIKVILKERLFSPMVVARFLVEAESVAKLEHPNIVQIYESGEHDGNYFYTMPYVEGQDLSKLISSPLTMPSPRRAVEIIEQVARAVQHAHDHAVIHRDIKPANIMLDKSGVARLTDFGLAKIMEENEASMKRPEVTTEGQIIGTPSYMSPEQAQGQLHRSNTWTDIYALGATLYALLSGNAPFAGKTHIETLRMVVETEAPRLHKATNKIPVDLDTICEKCLRKEPTDRYRSAADLADDLRRWLDGYPISIRATTSWERTVRWARRNPVVASLTVATAASLLIGTVVSTLFGIEAQRQATVANANAQQTRKILEENVNFVSEGILAKEPGMQAARKAILENSLEEYETLLTTAEADGVTQRELAGTLYLVGKLRSELGQRETAREALERAAAIQGELLKTSPNDVELLTSASKSHNELASSFKRELDQRFLNDVTKTTVHSGYQKSWEENAKKVKQLRKQAVQIDSSDPELLRLLANAHMNEGVVQCQKAGKLVATDRKAARELYATGIAEQKKAQKLRKQAMGTKRSAALQRDYAKGFMNLAMATHRQVFAVETDAERLPLLESAAELFTTAIKNYEPLVESPPGIEEETSSPNKLAQLIDDTLKQPPTLDISRCYFVRGNIDFLRNEIDKSIQDYTNSARYLVEETNRNPRIFSYQAQLSATYYNLMKAYRQKRAFALADTAFESCRAAMIEMLRIVPVGQGEDDNRAAKQFVNYSIQYAEDLRINGKAQLAFEALEKSSEQLRQLSNQSATMKGIGKYASQLKKLASELKAEAEGSEKSI